MADPISQLRTGLGALEQELDMIANNLANINTTGFKRSVNSFSRQLMDIEGQEPVERENTAVPFAEVLASPSIDYSQGILKRTERPLDVAIEGKGYFVVETPQGQLYTRNGVLQVNSQGNLVDLEGRMIAGADGPIIIPPGISLLELNISEQGIVGSVDANFGRLKMVEFGEDEGKLEPVGYNTYKSPQDVNPQEAENAVVRQGFRESSNVKMMDEMIQMVAVSRLYQMHTDIINKHGKANTTIVQVANG